MKVLVISWLVLFATRRQRDQLREYWNARWKATCMPWSANAKYLEDHWKEGGCKAEEFINSVISEGARGKEVLLSQWAKARVFSAAGDLVARGDRWRTCKLLWGVQDVLIFVFIGEWMRKESVGRAVPEGDMNKKNL